MSNGQKLTRKLGLQLATAGAASALLLVSPAFAQQGNQDMNQAATTEIRQLDQNNDQQLQWDELEPRFEEAGLADQWDEDRVMSEFDQDDNDALDAQEYQLLLVEVGQQGQSEQTVQRGQGSEQEVVVQSQQPRINVDTKPAQVQVDPAEPNVSVQQQEPNVTVQPADPDVTVDQKEPQITVTQPEPKVDVNVTVPEPEIEVTQREPDVNVDKGQPQVQVEQQEPQVEVSQGQPDVSVQQPEPDISVQPAQPAVSVDQQEQARVQVEDEQQQADVEVQQTQPDVQVGQAEAQVEVQEAQGANVDIQAADTAETDVEQDQQTDEVAVEEVTEMEPTAAGVSSQEQQQMRQTTQSQSALDQMRIEELEGTTVYNAEGRELGSVEQVVVGQSANDLGIVITVGGILGFGGDDVLIPLDEVEVTNDQLVWQTTRTPDEMRESAFDERSYTRATTETVGELRQNR